MRNLKYLWIPCLAVLFVCLAPLLYLLCLGIAMFEMVGVTTRLCRNSFYQVTKAFDDLTDGWYDATR